MHPGRPARGSPEDVSSSTIYHCIFGWLMLERHAYARSRCHEGAERPWNPLNRCLPESGRVERSIARPFHQLPRWRAKRLWSEYPSYDVDCSACAAAALYVCRLRAFDFDPWGLQHSVDADGYLSEHRHSCGDRGLAVHRPLGGPD